jgi:sugar phosphate isomerase/epimerase
MASTGDARVDGSTIHDKERECMAGMSRRKFFKIAAADAAVAGFLAGGTLELRAHPLGLPIGSQTWPHRAMLKDDFPGLVKTLADIGVTRLELCSPIGYGAEFAPLANGQSVKQLLADHGMKAESSHFSMRELREKQAESIAWAADVGITQMITATLGDGNGGSNPTMDQVKKAADEYNKIAAVAAKAGMQQGLHNEGFEVSMVDGKRTYDLLFDLLDPTLVKFQFQMSTIANGLVAADYFMKYPGRFMSMHIQDVPRGAGGQGVGRGQVAVGKGVIDWVKTFTAAKVGGVKNYFVEQSMDLTTESIAALKTLHV